MSSPRGSKRSGSTHVPCFKAVRSDLSVSRNSGWPWLTLFLEDGGCVFFNPNNGDVEKTTRDFSGSRFLASCGKWFLMLDISESKLYIIDVLTGNRKDLPPLEKILSNPYAVERVGVGEFTFELPDDDGSVSYGFADEIRARLWVDEKTGEWSLVWFFDAPSSFLCFLKTGNDAYSFIPVGINIPKMLTGLLGLVLRGHRVYILTTRFFVRVIDFSSGQQEEVTGTEPPPSAMFSCPGMGWRFTIAVTTAEEVLLVTTTTFETSERTFRVYKKDPNADPHDYTPDLVDVDSLGDEALLLDLGITVPANHAHRIKPNCIYFTRHECIRYGTHDRGHVLPPYEVDICVFNLATKSLEPFSAPSNMKLKDARWFLPLTS